MKHTEKLSSLFINGENRKCVEFLQKLYENTSNKEYAQALIRVLLIETVKSLNENVVGFYFSEEEMADRLFDRKNSKSVEAAVEDICLALKLTESLNKQSSFEKAKSYILSHFEESQFSIGNAAEYAGITSAELSRLFVKNEGIAPSDFAAKLRVEKSLEHLEKYSVSEAGIKVGFLVQESYIRAFKKHMGVTPGSWKRNKLFL